MIDFLNIKLPFTINDLLSTGFELLAFVGGYLLLSLSLKFVPMLISIIKYSIYGYKQYNYFYPNDSDWEGGKKPSKFNIYRKSLGKAIRDRDELKYWGF